ncbi:hypothetical protein [Streptomyces sp. Ac-502]|uniref:hypothetical protein n=1 Tax=Streptomyces sp. Ac-502 TaxID=3342801 RepID=UPI0038624A48
MAPVSTPAAGIAAARPPRREERGAAALNVPPGSAGPGAAAPFAGLLAATFSTVCRAAALS